MKSLARNPALWTVAGGLILLTCNAFIASGQSHDEPGLAGWAFVLGDWELVETRYGFDGALIQTNTGTATFSRTMNGRLIQELQELPHGDDDITALHVFVYNARTEEIEIARTDSGHYGFWVIVGKKVGDRIELVAKYPDPNSDVTRRITYQQIDSDHFTRQLEFSTDQGESWFVRSEWNYTRR